MYIKKLELLNFQVIKEFNADFAGNVYFITGDNELGKSTLLKAIGALLTGQRDDVLRVGEKKGFAKMVVGDDGEEYEVSLSFTEANPRGTLTIKQKSSGMQTSNVSMLQKIFGYQDFDAVEFSRWSETAEGRRKQIAVVKSLLPESIRERIEAIDAETAKIKSDRTGVNRDVKTFGALVESAKKKLPDDPERYSEPIDVASLMERQKTIIQLSEKAKTVKEALKQRTTQLAGADASKKQIEDEYNQTVKDAAEKAKEIIERAKAEYEATKINAGKTMTAKLEELNANIEDWKARKSNAETWLKKYNATNPEAANLSDEIAKANEHNARYNLVARYKEEKTRYDEVAAKSGQMDARLDELIEERASLIQNSELPIAGLSFNEDGLTLNGIPFVPGKVSDSQKMEIAAKLIIASNPTVKVFCIARGESLGAKRLETIIDIARRNGFQGFIEQVTRGQNEMMVEEYTEK